MEFFLSPTGDEQITGWQDVRQWKLFDSWFIFYLIIMGRLINHILIVILALIASFSCCRAVSRKDTPAGVVVQGKVLIPDGSPPGNLRVC